MPLHFHRINAVRAFMACLLALTAWLAAWPVHASGNSPQAAESCANIVKPRRAANTLNPSALAPAAPGRPAVRRAVPRLMPKKRRKRKTAHAPSALAPTRAPIQISASKAAWITLASIP